VQNQQVLVAGVDSSTQSSKIIVCDAATGEVVREGRAPHPEGTECHPDHWLTALREAAGGVVGGGLLDGVRALSVAGQQHGMVVLDSGGEVVRPALLWNDVRSAEAATKLVDELGGPQAWADAIGTVPVASFTVTKLRWLAEHEPENAAWVSRVLLPHDWLTWQLAGRPEVAVTDRGEASGTGYFSPSTGEYRPDLLRMAFGRDLGLPRVARPGEAVGETADGVLLGPGTGDNMGAALGLDLHPGDAVVSIGTSGTVFAVAESPSSDPSGEVAGFADATGRFLPLVCTLNAARVIEAAARMLRADRAEFDALALAAAPGAGGLTLLPYFDGERTPNRPEATGLFGGLRTQNTTPENVARAAVEGLLCGLADGLDALRAQGVSMRRVLLIGGAAASEAVRSLAPAIFGLPVSVPASGEYVARGAARQAAWALAGSAEPPDWSGGPMPSVEAEPDTATRARYASLRDRTADW
jgi:xylulokinase